MPIHESEDGYMVHYPRNPDHFEFDAEVAEVFDSMAERSIPMYRDQHKLHCQIALDRFTQRKVLPHRQIDVLDVGASTGNFMVELMSQLLATGNEDKANLTLMDPSPEMCFQCQERLGYYEPNIITADADFLSVMEGAFDIINMAYVYQFVPIHQRGRVFYNLNRLCKPGGLVFLSQKFTYNDGTRHGYEVDSLIQDRYVRFRLDNGYSLGEIDAKTKALRNSMWLQSDTDFTGQIMAAGFSVYPITRWLSFGSYLAVKG